MGEALALRRVPENAGFPKLVKTLLLLFSRKGQHRFPKGGVGKIPRALQHKAKPVPPALGRARAVFRVAIARRQLLCGNADRLLVRFVVQAHAEEALLGPPLRITIGRNERGGRGPVDVASPRDLPRQGRHRELVREGAMALQLEGLERIAVVFVPAAGRIGALGFKVIEGDGEALLRRAPGPAQGQGFPAPLTAFEGQLRALFRAGQGLEIENPGQGVAAPEGASGAGE